MISFGGKIIYFICAYVMHTHWKSAIKWILQTHTIVRDEWK